MIRLLKRCFELFTPFIWKGRLNRIATIMTVFVVLLNMLSHIWTPRLLGKLATNYATTNFIVLCFTVLSFMICWGIDLMTDSFTKITFYRVINSAIRDTRIKVIMHMHKVSPLIWDNYAVSEIVSANERLAWGIKDFMGIVFVTVIPAIVSTLAISSVMINMDTDVIYFILVAMLSYVTVYFGIRKYLKLLHNAWEITDKVRVAANDSLRNSTFSRLNANIECNRLSEFFDIEAKEWGRTTYYKYRINIIQGALFLLCAGFFILHLSANLKVGKITVADFIAMQGYVFSIYRKMYTVTDQTRDLFGSVTDMSKVLKLIDLPTQKQEKNFIIPDENYNGPILCLRDVHFSYAESTEDLLSGISLDINIGDRIAIIGPSGSGKSTISRLITGIYQPTKGKILFYGIDIRNLDSNLIGRYVYLIGQDCYVVSGTVSSNDTNDGIIKTNNSDYFKNKMQHVVGDSGKRLSNGERQRLLIARCLAHNPQVVILDETFSSLDNSSAQDLLKNVLENVPTVILITHQTYLLKGFNKIYYLQNNVLTRLENS